MIKRKTSSQRGYDSQWRKVRRMKLRTNPLCEECENGRLIIKATMVHHIIPIEDGGDRLAWNNLMSLCEACHSKKHSSNELGNVGGCRIDGMPIHQHHPWNR